MESKNVLTFLSSVSLTLQIIGSLFFFQKDSKTPIPLQEITNNKDTGNPVSKTIHCCYKIM